MSDSSLFDLEREKKTVARVAVDVPLAHLDRLFDYEAIDSVAPGVRVMVRFAGRKVPGFVVDVVESSSFEGKLAPIESVISTEPVLTPEVYALARDVADRYGSVLADVLRNAVPPRHAKTEKTNPGRPFVFNARQGDPQLWADYEHGEAFLANVGLGQAVRAVMSLRPDHDGAQVIAAAVSQCLASSRGAIVCVPDARDLDHYARVFSTVLGPDSFSVLSSSEKPAERYRAFLSLLRGETKVALGTRSAAFAPVRDLGLVVIVDDGDDLFVEQRSPYAHAREVLLLRSLHQETAALFVSLARSCEAQRLVETGWAQSLEAFDRKKFWPRVSVAESKEGERLPHETFTAIREGLNEGPVLVQVPRRGYRSALSCQGCRTPARCSKCTGPLIQSSLNAPPACSWCGHISVNHRCVNCGSTALRAPVVGAERLAEELGKAFPNTVIRRSSGDQILDQVEDSAAIVIATPGAEPRVTNGYSAAVILDTAMMLSRPALRVVEEAHRRWFNAIAQVRSTGRVVVVGEPGALQGLVRLDPIGVASRELADRAEAHLPPAAHVGVIEGDHDQLINLGVVWPEPSEVFGPVVLDEDRSRLIVRVPYTGLQQLSEAVATLNAARSSRKLPPFTTRINPYDI